jgi:translocation and assembly module TamB
LTGFELKDPRVAANITGTWEQPAGTIRVQAVRIARVRGEHEHPWPALDSVDLALTGDRDGVSLDTLSLSVEGQAVRAQGRLEVGAGSWKELVNHPVAFVQRHARLHLEIPDADLAAAANSLPPYLAPRGRLTADLEFKGAGVLEGSLQLHDAATRPLGPLGILQEINADVRLNGRHVELRNVTAKAGGQPITLSGTIDYTTAREPRFDVAVQGTNLPFVRKTGLLVRGDLDLQLRTLGSGPTSLTGTVRLHDSLLLADVRAFLPGGAKGGTQQPPYFSVTTQPFSSWEINVDVSGDRFLRLRTPVFNGVASSQFRVRGTFGEPRLLGEIVIDEGRVLMPFAQFAVKQGTARITEANPHELALFVRATGRRLNYEVTMEISGTAAAPSVVFTSSPALDSKQLLLMVMTGAAPQDGPAYSDNQRYARLGAYLGRSLLGTFSGETDTSDRLTLTGGEQVSRQGRETYDIEYRMTERWKLVGEYDEFDDYNVGLKWRLFPGRREPEVPPHGTK